MKSAETYSGAPVDFLREIIGGMPKKRYQDPALEIRNDVSRPYYFIRYSISEPTAAGPKIKRRAKILGYCDETKEKQALRARAEFLNTLNDGRTVLQSQVRFRDVAKKYLITRLEQLGSAAQSRYRLQIENHILPAFGDMRLSDIDRETVESWLLAKAQPVKRLDGSEKAGLGWYSRTDLKGILSAIFRAARDWKLWDSENPCRGVKIGRKRSIRERRILTRDQLRELLGSLDPEIRFMVMISFATGLRISEILGLQWGDIDLETGTLKVARRFHRGDIAPPKSENSERTRQLGALVDDFRRQYPGPHAAEKFIFADKWGGIPDDRDLQRERLRPVAKRIGVYFPGFGFHSFRRQNVTLRQTIGGAQPLEAQKMAGHGSVDMTLLYTCTDEERERDQVGKMLEWLLESPTVMKQ